MEKLFRWSRSLIARVFFIQFRHWEEKMNNIIQIIYNKNKKDIFPHIKDWTKPWHTHLKHKRSFKQLTKTEWFFLHPTAYNLISFAIPISACINFTIISIISYFWIKSLILTIISAIFAVILIPEIVKKIRNYKYTKDITFYDLWMKEEKPIKITDPNNKMEE